MKKILFLGPQSNVKRGLLGGATISFGYLTDYFKSRGERISIINTKRFFGFFAAPVNALHVLLQLIIKGASVDIIFLNSSRGGTRLLAPLVAIIALLYRNKFVFRPFGGDMREYTSRYGSFSTWIFKNSVLKADLLYLQTQELIDHYQSADIKIKQLVTSRKRPSASLIKSLPQYRKRFIYLGFINEEKGINLLLEAKQRLGSDYLIHAYGPIKDARYTSLDEDFYKGVLAKEKVLSTLSEYDVLLLPSYYRGEGYPGAIIESYSLGKPVITTRWKAIPEIVKDGQTGFLIEIKDLEALMEAILSIDEDKYSEMSNNALQYFNDTFDEEKVLEQVRQDLKEL